MDSDNHASPIKAVGKLTKHLDLKIMHRRRRPPMSAPPPLVAFLFLALSLTRVIEAAPAPPTSPLRDSAPGARTVCFAASSIGCLPRAGFGVGGTAVSGYSASPRFERRNV
ncbi:unnamed protein product, partial [Laminaria digitata]